MFGFGNWGDIDLGEGVKMYLLVFLCVEEIEVDLVGMDIVLCVGYDFCVVFMLW